VSEAAHLTGTLGWRQAYHRPWVWGLALISLGLLSWVIWRASLGQVWRSLRAVDCGLIALSIPLILAGLTLRAMRWRVLLSPLGKLPFWACCRSMLVGYLANNLLPARAGELVRAYVLGQQNSISKAAILATIVVERVVDAVILLLVLASLLIALPVPAWARQIALGGAAVVVVSMCVLIAARRSHKYIVTLFQSLLSRLPRQWQSRGVSLADNFLVGLTSFQRPTDALIYSFMTIMVWSTEILLFWLVMRAFSISLTIPSIALVVTTGTLSTMIPSLPGYVGTYEFVLVNILVSMGVLIGPATAFALGIHGLCWVTVNIVGAGCALQLGVVWGRSYPRMATGQISSDS
jgi:glycosyltransferase 2 family protein